MGNKDIERKALDHYGIDSQMVVAIEELSELQKELCKHLRGADNTEAIAEEIADVLIMCEQMMLYFNLEKTVDMQIAYKLHRLSLRMGE